MKVKFYKGPWHGKSAVIDPNQLRSGRLEIVVSRAGDLLFDRATQADMVNLNLIKATYEIRMVSMDLHNTRYCSPAMHPDGSLFLEYIRSY